MDRLRWYLAGKISDCSDWRLDIVRGLKDADGRWISGQTEGCKSIRFPIMKDAVMGRPGWDYVGPYYQPGDHCGWQDDGTHGRAVPGDHGQGVDRLAIHRLCVRAVAECDVLFAWITTEDCCGTLIEIGLALAQGKRIIVCFDDEARRDRMWFADHCDNEHNRFSYGGVYHTAREAFLLYGQANWFNQLYEGQEAYLRRCFEGEKRSILSQHVASLPSAQEIRRDPQRNFSGDQKKEIYLRANGHCQSCAQPLDSDWHADHVVPWSRGGRTEIINGQALCQPCNGRKSAKVLTVDQEG